jgi:hypothetical protein
MELKTFHVSLLAADELFDGEITAASAQDALKALERGGAWHPFSFFFLWFHGLPPIDEMFIVDDEGKELCRWRSGWVWFLLGMAERFGMDEPSINRRRYTRRYS